MANTIQSDFTYLWLDCSGHGWKASLGLTRCISSGTVPHECSYALSEASSAVERIHLLLWEPSWLHPEAAQVFQHQSYWRGVWGEGARRRSRNTQHRPSLDPGSSWVLETWLCTSCARPTLPPGFCTCSIEPQVLRGSLGQAQRDEHHKQRATVCPHLQCWGTGCEWGAEK